MKIFLGIMMIVWTAMMFDEKSMAYFKTYATCYGLTVFAFIACEVIPHIFRG